MQKIFGWIKDYATSLDRNVFAGATLFIAIAIFINYRFGLNDAIAGQPSFTQYVAWYFIFLVTFSFGYFIIVFTSGKNYFRHHTFLLLLLIAPLIFSWKMVYSPHFYFSPDAHENEYWNDVIYWPLKITGVTLMLFLVHYLFHKKEPFYGVSFRGLNIWPYLFMVLLMAPLIAAAATQKDFLAVYPKFQQVQFLSGENKGLYKLLYELSYGSDFFTIELFFRGFLVLAFAKFAGKDALLPMAMFYCTIHFGKPLGECISSYFGGLILGVVIYHTKSIFGGLIVHVGIAWLMELAGYMASR